MTKTCFRPASKSLQFLGYTEVWDNPWGDDQSHQCSQPLVLQLFGWLEYQYPLKIKICFSYSITCTVVLFLSIIYLDLCFLVDLTRFLEWSLKYMTWIQQDVQHLSQRSIAYFQCQLEYIAKMCRQIDSQTPQVQIELSRQRCSNFACVRPQRSFSPPWCAANSLKAIWFNYYQN